jgi:hypothetical protein
MLRTLRLVSAAVSLALLVFGLAAMSPAGAATTKGCSKVGHHVSGAQYDIWFTAGKTDNAPDRLYKVEPSTFKASAIETDASLDAGYLVRGIRRRIRTGTTAPPARWSPPTWARTS